MLKRFVVCCTATTITLTPMPARCQSFEPSLHQQLNSNLIIGEMNNIGLQNTLPPSRRAPGYGNTSATWRGRVAKPYESSGQTVNRNLDYNGLFAKYAKAANIPRRDPSSSMAMHNAIGWSIANGVELSEKNPIHIAGVRSLQRQASAIMRQNADMNDASNRQRLDEELTTRTVALDSLRIDIRDRKRPGTLAELSDSVHDIWQKKFGVDLRSMVLTEAGLVNR
jgi:hypothetical protein